MTDLVIVLAGVVYFVASLLLFVLGVNMAFLSILVWRRGRPGSDESAGRTASESERLQLPDAELPMVTIQLPIYNELYVAERVIRAACQIDYPADRLEIQVLDDSTDETATLIAHVVDEAKRSGVDIVHLHRTDREGYKAGALAEGLKVSSGEFVAIFDADFIPPPDFLRRTVGEFADPKVAFVQGRWGHINRNYSVITRLQSLAIDAHFMVEQSARRHLGYWFNFNGTAGIWRLAAIEDAGGWTADTLTEDLDLSYRAHLRGWRGQFRADLDVPGELPAQMSSFRRQQHRWARGSLECAHKLLPAVWRTDIPLATKFQATAHLTAYGIHLLLATIALIYPIVLFAGIRFEGFATLYGFGYLFALSSLAPGIFFITGQRQLSRSWIRELPKIAAVTILGSGLMVNTVRAAIQIFTRKNPEFERTAKFGMEEPGQLTIELPNTGERSQAEEPQTNNSWLQKRYQLDLDRIVYAELIFGLYSLSSVWFAFNEQNWGIFLYAMIFAAGMLGVATITVVQAVAVRRAAAARADQLSKERADQLRRVEQAQGGETVDLRDTGLSGAGHSGAGHSEANYSDHRYRDPVSDFSVGANRAILIMAKQPKPGISKTRLHPAMSAEEAAELSECFVLDAVALSTGLGDAVSDLEVRVAGTPASAEGYFTAVAPGIAFVAQQGEGLNERLHNVMAGALTDGFDQVVAINSDSPTMPNALLKQAFEALNQPSVDVVLGPAEDGGYYLIGWKQRNDRLIREVEMSTANVLADTMVIAEAEGLRVELLPSWYDVDEPRDLQRLREDVKSGNYCGPNTKRFMADRPELGSPSLQR